MKVSVIMGVYNCEDTIRDAVDSILKQTFKNWEFIICDDNSTDGTLKILKEYADKYPENFVILHNNKNMRLAASLNRCLKAAKGEYVARMDGDDMSLPKRLEEQVHFLDCNRKYDLVGTQMVIFDEYGESGIRKVKEIPGKRDLKKGSPFCHATVMIRSECYKSLGGYRLAKETNRCEDMDLWFRFFAAGYRGYNIQKPLYKVREDTAAYKRRAPKHGIEAAKVYIKGYQLLDYPKSDYIYALKPILTSIIPGFIMKWYAKRRDYSREVMVHENTKN